MPQNEQSILEDYIERLATGTYNELRLYLNRLSIIIFDQPPYPHSSIQLKLGNEMMSLSDPNAKQNFMQNILTLILYNGMYILYGHENPLLLSRNDSSTLQKYINSLGYIFEMYANNTQITNKPQTIWDALEKNIIIHRYSIEYYPIY